MPTKKKRTPLTPPTPIEILWIDEQGYKPYGESAPESPGLFRSAADSALSFGQGVVTGGKMLTDLAGADNPVSQALGDISEGLGELQSPQRRAEQQRRSQLIDEALQSGDIGHELNAYLGAFLEAPIDTVLNALGTAVPTIGAAMLTGGGAPGAAIATALGAAQGVGVVKGAIYETVKNEAVKRGMSEDEAEARAVAAQAYTSENIDSLLAGGALGALAGRFGAESSIVGRMSGAGSPSMLRRTFGHGMGESFTEAPQGAQEQIASNLAAQREGFDVPTFRGAAGSALLEGIAGFGVGASLGAVSSPESPEPPPGPLTRAADIASRTMPLLPGPEPERIIVDEVVDDRTRAIGGAPSAVDLALGFTPQPTETTFMADERGNVAPMPPGFAEEKAAERAAAQQRATDLGMTPDVAAAQERRAAPRTVEQIGFQPATPGERIISEGGELRRSTFMEDRAAERRRADDEAVGLTPDVRAAQARRAARDAEPPLSGPLPTSEPPATPADVEEAVTAGRREAEREQPVDDTAMEVVEPEPLPRIETTLRTEDIDTIDGEGLIRVVDEAREEEPEFAEHADKAAQAFQRAPVLTLRVLRDDRIDHAEEAQILDAILRGRNGRGTWERLAAEAAKRHAKPQAAGIQPEVGREAGGDGQAQEEVDGWTFDEPTEGETLRIERAHKGEATFRIIQNKISGLFDVTRDDARGVPQFVARDLGSRQEAIDAADASLLPEQIAKGGAQDAGTGAADAGPSTSPGVAESGRGSERDNARRDEGDRASDDAERREPDEGRTGRPDRPGEAVPDGQPESRTALSKGDTVTHRAPNGANRVGVVDEDYTAEQRERGDPVRLRIGDRRVNVPPESIRELEGAPAAADQAPDRKAPEDESPQENYEAIIDDMSDEDIEALFARTELEGKNATTAEKRAMLRAADEAEVDPIIQAMDEAQEFGYGMSAPDRFTPEEDWNYEVANFVAPERSVNANKEAGPFITPKEAADQLAQWKAEAKRIGQEEDHSNEVIISLFDATGEISKPWREAGYDVLQYDIKLGDDLLEHFPMDDLLAIKESGKTVAGVIAQPPCTCFTSSGARWWSERHDKHDRAMVNRMFGPGASRYFSKPKEYTRALVSLVDLVIGETDPRFFAMENPVGRIATQMGLPKPTLAFDPHVYGNPYTKRTHLWGKFNPDLPTANVEPTQGSLMHKLWSTAEKKGGTRSITPEGFAYAFFMANKDVAAEQKPAEPEKKAEKPAPLYASRPVTNADAIIAWAREQGFKTTLQAADLHVTVAYSSDPIPGDAVADAEPSVTARGGKRSVEPLGDGGAVVLKFASGPMQRRWQAYRDAGASWDHESYQPHITLTYDAGDLDLSKVKPYRGPIELGPERQEPLNENKADEDYKGKEAPTGAGEPTGEATGGEPAKTGESDTRSRAQAGGEEGVNGYFYKGGQFLPSTMAAPGKWKVDKKWVTAGRALIGPNEFGHQPTPFSRSLYELAGVGMLTKLVDGQLEVNSGVSNYDGTPVTADQEVRPGVRGVLGKEALTLQEIVDAWNKGQRWFNVKPDAETITTEAAAPAEPTGGEPPADKEPPNEYPFGKAEREDQFFGSRVRVLPDLKGDEAWEGTVQSALNGGRLFSVKRDSNGIAFRIAGDRIEVLERVENGKAAPQETAAQRKARERREKEAAIEQERELFRGYLADDAVQQAAATMKADEFAAFVRERAPQASDKFVRELRKQAKEAHAQAEKNKNRDPAVYEAAVIAAMKADNVDPSNPAMATEYRAGFGHAIAGKRKSTLSGQYLNVRLHGYESARAWIKTDEGKAYFEGRAPTRKIENTGVDLRRHWEAMRAQMKSDESDMDRAWKQIAKATNRADLFAPLFKEGITPGMRVYLEKARSTMKTFGDFLDYDGRDWYGRVAFRHRRSRSAKTNLEYMLEGSRYPGELSTEDRQKWETDAAFRANWLRGKADEYLDLAREYVSTFENVGLREAAERFSEKFFTEDSREKGGWAISMTDETPTGRRMRAIYSSFTDFAQLRSASGWFEVLLEKEDNADILKERKDALTPPRLDRVTRENLPDHRNGRDVTPDEVKSVFGFADVGFGNYVTAAERQEHLNYAFDAFMDLAQFWKMDPKMVGFGGRLHFTIGALGHGKFGAHFSPNHPGPGGTVAVINLTNTRGDGTVFHEWTHAFDHFAGDGWRGRVRGMLLDTLRHEPRTVEAVESYAKKFLRKQLIWRGAGRMDPVQSAVFAMQRMDYGHSPKTRYATNAEALGKDYWGNDEEMIARAAEAWALDRLGGINSYLVNPAWAGEGVVTGKTHRGTPYPEGNERKEFADTFDALRSAVSWTKDGQATIDVAKFNEGRKDLSAGEARRAELADEKAMAAWWEDIQREDREKAEAERRREQQEMDEAAAAALAELQAVDPPKPDEAQGPLSDDELSDIFDQAAAELREETQEKPRVPPPGRNLRDADPIQDFIEGRRDEPPTLDEVADDAAAKSASKMAAEAAKLGVKGVDEALTGLVKLFGGGKGRLNSFPGGFDEDTYAQAKPHFTAALKAFQDAGKTLKDLFKFLIEQFGDGIKVYAVRFAKEESLGAQLAPAAAERTPSRQVADWVKGELDGDREIRWQDLFKQADVAFGGTQAEGKYTPKDAYDALESGVNLHIAENARLYAPNSGADQATAAVRSLRALMDRIPTQSKRTAEQDEFQQFSTPPTLAFPAAWVANITESDTMLEPSAGVGGIGVFGQLVNARLVFNELSSRRAAVLRDLFPGAQVFTENAEQLHNVLPDDVQPSVVVMNPPFSATAGRMQGARDTQIGAQHVEQALKRLAPGGRLVAIVGRGMARDKATFRDWWRKIDAKYDVRAAIPVDGADYAKYGTTFSNALLVIDKVAPKADRVVVTREAKSHADLIGILEGIRNDRPEAQIQTRIDEADERDAALDAHRRPDAEGEGDADTGRPDSGRPAGLGEGEPAPDAAGIPDGDAGVRGGRGGRRPGSGVSRTGRGRARPDGGADAARRGDGADAQPGGPSDSTGVTIGQAEATTEKGFTDAIFEEYRPQRLSIEGARPHPGALVQSAAMASVLPPPVTYTPNLPAEVITEGKLSLAQLESIVYAGAAHEQMLPSGERRGYFIGDGTGVGKGREISGIILDNMRQGRKLAVWISEKQGLMNDAKRDFASIGGDPDLIFNQNKTEAEAKIAPRDGILFTTYSTLRSGAQSQAAGSDVPGVGDMVTFELPWMNTPHTGKALTKGRKNRRGGYTVAVDYGGDRVQVESRFVSKIDKAPDPKAKKKGQSRLEQLADFLGPEFDGVIAFDEAHNAGNAVPIKGDRGVSQPSAQALAVVALQERLPKARIVYVSATGATQVSNLSYATRMGLWGEGTPFPTVHNFIAQMEAGGLATMELVARDAKQMGVYIARSLSYDGVTYGRLEHELTPIQRDIYNRLAEGWQVTLQNFMEALVATGVISEEGTTRNTRALAAAKSAYWGAQQRFFNQIITSMQMPSVVEQIRADLDAGDAIVLQLVNTNEAQQERALARRRDETEGTDLEDLDLTPRDMLIQMVEKAFPVVQMEEYTDEDGKKLTRPAMDSAGNPILNKEMVEKRDALIEDLKQIRVPDGPLEIILNEFGPELVAEVTGRSQRVVRKPDPETGEVRAQLERRGSGAARADADAFMNDKKRILVFSDAGGTGFSFQADLDKPNQRKRKHYLIQPGWRADKAVQGFGRTHRTNQASAPHYYLASTNIPAQKRFLSSIARRLDQLGALTKGQRDTANQGLFSEKDNLESKYAEQAVTQFFRDLRLGRMPDLEWDALTFQMGLDNLVDDNGQLSESRIPGVSQFLNRMLSLELDMQTKVFDTFIDLMEEKVEQAIERGELDTGLETLQALSIKTTHDEVVYTDAKTGAETRYVELELTQPNKFFDPPAPELREPGAFRWIQMVRSGRVYGLRKIGTTTHSDGSVVERIRQYGTGGPSYKDSTDFADRTSWKEISEAEALDLWAAENAKRPPTVTRQERMIVGAILPIWDRLDVGGGAMRVARALTDDGRRLLGRVIPARDVQAIRKRLNVSSPAAKMGSAEIMAAVLKGKTAELANGWKLERARVSNDLRVELKTGYLTVPAARELTNLGIFAERIQWNDRYFIPAGAAGVPVLDKLRESKPVVDLIDPKGGEPKFSRGSSTGAGMKASAVKRVADAIRAMWKNGPEVVVVQSLSDRALPDAIRQSDADMRSAGADNRAEGVFFEGTVYLIADGLDTDSDVLRVLSHEALGHYGLRGVFGDRLEQILAQLARSRPREVERKMREYGLEGAEGRLIAAEEILANMAQSQPTLGFVRRALAAIRTWLRRLGLPLRLSDGELIRDLILPAREFVQSGREPAQATPQGPRYSMRDEEFDDDADLAEQLEEHGVEAESKLDAEKALMDGDRVFVVHEMDGEPTEVFSTETLQSYTADQIVILPAQFVRGPRFSRRITKKAVADYIADLFKTHGKVTWWDRTIGTKYDLAQRNAAFKRAFDAAQNYLSDVADFASRAADLAPSILPKFSGIRDALRKPVAKKDLDAIAAPLFEGTLAGDSVTQGRVWTNAELRERFNLNDRQIELYREARRAIDQSLDDMGKTDLLRYAGDDGNAVREQVLAAPSIVEANRILQRHLAHIAAGESAGRATTLTNIAATINEKANLIAQLKRAGYAPLSRFGRYSVYVTRPDEDGGTEQVFFGVYDTQRAANRAARQFRENPEFADATVTQDEMSTEQFKLFQGVNVDTLELFGEVAGIERTELFEEYVRLAKSNRSALKRLIGRKGVEGYSRDVSRVLAAFLTSNARAASANLHTGELNRAASDAYKDTRAIGDEATKLVQFVRDGNDPSGALRGLMFFQYLGGSAASALVNMTQPITMSYPYLAKFVGARRAATDMTRAMRQAVTGVGSDDDLKTALKRAESEGIVSPQEIHHLYSEAGMGLQRNTAIRRMTFAWGAMFSAAEQFNRRATFIAAYRIARERGEGDPFAFAEQAVVETQGIYNRGNRANWGRNPVGASMLTFKQFMVSYIEFLRRLPVKQQALALGVLVLVAGLEELPFADDVRDVIDTTAHALGYNWSTKRAQREWLVGLFGKEAAEFMLHGLSALPFMPLDASARLGLGNLVPGTGLLLGSTTDKTREITEVLGAPGSFFADLAEGAGRILSGEPVRAAETVAPLAIRNAMKALDMYQTGMYRDSRGRRVMDVDGYDALVKAIGFQPAGVARAQRAAGLIHEQAALVRNVKAEFNERMARARFERNTAEIRSVQRDLRDWNRKNPEARLSFDESSINRRIRAMRQTRAERLMRTTPKEVRAAIRELAE